MVVQKALKDSMKDNIVAKLARHADDLFADVIKVMQKESVRTLWDKDWLSVVSGKQSLYNGLSQFHQSKVCNTAKNIGEEISRLQYCLELFQACQTRSGMAGLGGCSDWMKRANRALTDAEKDNAFIYHERIPDVTQLTTIGRAAVVKPTALPDKFLPNDKELFSALMPIHTHQAVAAYEVRKQDMVGKELNRMKVGTNMINEILNSMNLPAALEDTTGGGVPASLKEKSSAVIEAGGVDELESLVRELPDMLQRNTHASEVKTTCKAAKRQSKSSLPSPLSSSSFSPQTSSGRPLHPLPATDVRVQEREGLTISPEFTRSTSAIVEAMTRFSRQKKGGQFDLPAFQTLSYCTFCKIGICIGPNCLGQEKEPNKSKFRNSPTSSPNIPGLEGESSSTLTIIKKTPSRRSSMKAINPLSSIFQSYPKPIIPSRKKAKRKHIVKTKKPIYSPCSTSVYNVEVLQHLLLSCGVKSKSSQTATYSSSSSRLLAMHCTSLYRKLNVSELPCMRKVSLPGKYKGSKKPANFHSSSLLYTNEEIFAINMEELTYELKLIEERLVASKEVGKKIVEVSIFVPIKW